MEHLRMSKNLLIGSMTWEGKLFLEFLELSELLFDMLMMVRDNNVDCCASEMHHCASNSHEQHLPSACGLFSLPPVYSLHLFSELIIQKPLQPVVVHCQSQITVHQSQRHIPKPFLENVGFLNLSYPPTMVTISKRKASNTGTFLILFLMFVRFMP
jgi:hypothetical protein